MQDYIIEIIGGIGVILAAVSGSYLAAKAALGRVPFQNDLDEQQATKIAIESTKLLLDPLNNKIIELETRVKTGQEDFDRKINEMNGTYHIEMELTVGKAPIAQIRKVTKLEYATEPK